MLSSHQIQELSKHIAKKHQQIHRFSTHVLLNEVYKEKHMAYQFKCMMHENKSVKERVHDLWNSLKQQQ
jgi:hypothetical protein